MPSLLIEKFCGLGCGVMVHRVAYMLCLVFECQAVVAADEAGTVQYCLDAALLNNTVVPKHAPVACSTLA